MIPTVSTETIDLVERLIVAGVAVTTVALAEARPRLDLTFAQWRALLIVGREPDGLTISALARRIGTTLPATSRQLHRLEGRALVTLTTDTFDRRATRARLTPAGQAWRSTILESRRRSIEAALPAQRLDPGSAAWLEALASGLDAIVARRAVAASSASDAEDAPAAITAGRRPA